MLMPSSRTMTAAIITTIVAFAAQAPAFAAGGYIAKPPTPYHGPCALTAPQIRSVAVGDHCVAVARNAHPKAGELSLKVQP